MNKNKNSSFALFWERFSRHKLAQAAVVILILEVLTVIFLPMFMDLDPYSINPIFNAKPDSTHWLGTDTVGRDLFARLIYGGRISLLVGFSSTILSLIIGLPLGLIAGYYRGTAETLIMRTADIFMSFPTMILVLVMVAIFGNSLPCLILLIGGLAWPQPARLVYSRALTVRNMEYVEAARVGGCTDFEIIINYVLPNSVAPLWMNVAFQISSAILTESSLSFLGAGVQPPTASWGNIVYQAQNVIVLYSYPWIWIPAGLCLIVTIISINFVGEGIRDALDPKMKV